MNEITIHAVSNVDKKGAFCVNLVNGDNSLQRTYALQGLAVNQVYAMALTFSFMAVCNDDPITFLLDDEWCSTILEKDEKGEWAKKSRAKYITSLRSCASNVEFKFESPDDDLYETIKASAELKLEALEEKDES